MPKRQSVKPVTVQRTEQPARQAVITSKVVKTHLTQRFDEDVIDRFEKVVAQFPDANAALASLLNRSEEPQPPPQPQELHTADDIMRALECTDDQRELIERTINTTNFPWKPMFRVGIVAEAKNRFTYAERLATVDLSDAQARQHVRGAGYARCREILDGVMAANNSATMPAGRRYITAKLISKLGGVSPAMAIKFCEVCADEISEHNRAIGFSNPEEGRRHNQWIYGKPTKNTMEAAEMA